MTFHRPAATPFLERLTESPTSRLPSGSPLDLLTVRQFLIFVANAGQRPVIDVARALRISRTTVCVELRAARAVLGRRGRPDTDDADEEGGQTSSLLERLTARPTALLPSGTPLDLLTTRQLAIFIAKAAHRPMTEVARALGISRETLYVHLRAAHATLKRHTDARCIP